MDDLSQFLEEKAATVVPRIVAAWHLAVAGIGFGIAIWILVNLRTIWIWLAYSILTASMGCISFQKAIEAYANRRRTEAPDARMRRLESRSLYIPRPRRRDRE
jgi:hypothetical protein